MIPSWFAFVLLALAAYRTWHLLGLDTVLDGWRNRVTRLGEWEEGEPFPSGYRRGLDDFLGCPWCLGFWLTLGWWTAYQVSPHWATVAAVPFALSAVVGLLGSRL